MLKNKLNKQGLKKQVKGVGDAILPAEGGPIVSTMEGGIFQGTNNDDVLMLDLEENF